MDNSTMVENSIRMLFSWYDYILFVFMLGLSILVGIYFGFFAKQKQTTAIEYLQGGKQMTVVPIALSLIASSVSGTIMMGIPTDIYRYGTTYVFSCVGSLAVTYISYKAYVPVFYNLQVFSTYEYLELRFNKQMRFLSSVIFTIATILHIPMILYAPALAFAQATGANVYSICWLVAVVCIFYTTLGGLKAVVWTDALQFVLMVGSVIVVLVLGLLNIGGPAVVIQRAYEGDRLSHVLDFDPRKRDTLWTALIAIQFYHLGHVAIGQSIVQKYLALPSILDVKKAMSWFYVGITTMTLISITIGLIIYANYFNCDPISDAKIEKPDQIIALFIMETSQKVPGLAGLYIAGLMSAALSSLSAMINALSGTIYEDFISPFMSETTSQRTVSTILKMLVIIVGAIGTALVTLFDRMGSAILPVQISLMGITMGALVGLFSLGMLVPMANSKGGITGAVSSIVTMTTIITMTQIYKYQGLIHQPMKPISTEGCLSTPNSTVLHETALIPSEDEPMFIFLVSHWYYAMMGFFIVFVVGIPVSYFTKSKMDKPVSRHLISPVMQWCLKDEFPLNSNEYHEVDIALKIVCKDGTDEFDENKK